MSDWIVAARRQAARLLTASAVAMLMVGTLISAAPVAHADDDAAQATDPRFFAQTGFSISRDSFWDYFQHRGGTATFGYPVSKDFLFLGCQTQFFQREIMQQCGTGGVGTLNLLDDQFLPYTRMNGSTFPAADPAFRTGAPPVTDPNYATLIVDFVRQNAPDTFDGQPVDFGQTFFNTVSPDAAGTDDPNILALLDLEIWGAPTSAPAYDPTNHNFIYQRFQRGIMHYDAGCGCTQGLLLADYLKDLLTGQNLPPDLAAQAGSSPLLRAVVNGHTPTATVFGDAFVSASGSGTVAVAIPTATPTAAPATPMPTATAQPSAPLPVVATSISPDYGLSEFVWGHPSTTSRDLSLATSAGFHWQKTLFEWKLIEPQRGVYDWTEADRVVKASNAAGLKIIARLDFQPPWARLSLTNNANQGPPDNYQDYWDFVSQLVSRYKTGSPNGTIQAIEVWNEPNLGREWGGDPISQQSAANYVRLLSGAYQAAHAADPNVIVITAGLSPTGVRASDAMDDVQYLTWMYQAGLKGGVNYDVLGAHGNTQAPCVACDLNSLSEFPDPSFYFRRIEQLRQVQVQAGDAARQIWLLEFGWTADQVHPNYKWFAISEDQKAANIVQAYQYARQNWSPWIGVMSLWTLSDPSWTQDREEYWWAITNPDGSPRPAYTAVKNARQNGTLPG